MIPSTLLQGLFSKMLQGGFTLHKGGEKPVDGFSGILDRLTASGESPNAKCFSEKPSLTGHSFLSQLKKEFMASGRSLEEFKVGGGATDQFGDILVRLGFDADEVEQVLSSLSHLGTGTISIADLFNAASQLTGPSEDEIPPVTLDVSTLPDLERILQDLGLDLETSQCILSDALAEEGGIDLRTLASGIRRVPGGVSAEPSIDIGDQGGVVEKMKRIDLPVDGKPSLQNVLDELISEVEGLSETRVISEEDDEAGELQGSLLLSYLQQQVASLGSEGKFLQRLIASAEKESGGIDVGTLLNRLVQMKQEIPPSALNFDTTGEADARIGASESGKMSLLRFVSILESRVAAEESSGGVFKAGADQRPLAEVLGSFMKKVSPSADNPPQKQLVFQADIEGGKPFQKQLVSQAGFESGKPSESTWQPGSKAVEDSVNPKHIGKALPGTGTKEPSGQNSTQVFRPSILPGEGDRSFSENTAAREQAERLSQVLNAAGKNKTNKSTDDARFSMENVVREAKSGEGTAPAAKAMANRSLPGYLLNQVSRQILQLRRAGENEMTLQLKPPDLGRMKLTMEHTVGGMKVGIIVENAAAKDMLLANTGDLKTALADQGLRLDRIDVEARADFGQSMDQAGREFGRSGPQKGWRAGRNPGNGGGASDASPGTGTVARKVEAGRLDLVA